MTTDREQFEAWWTSTKVACDYGSAWQGWKARAARAAPVHTHRWNIDPQDDGSLLICEGEHEKNEACTYVRWTRAAPAQPDRPSTPIGWSDSDWIKHLQSLRIPSELLLLANDPLMGQALLRLIERAAPAQTQTISPKDSDGSHWAIKTPAQPDIECCERESGTCVQVHSKERLGDCTPENCRYTAPAQTRSQKLAEAGFTRRPTTLEIQLSDEDKEPAQPVCPDCKGTGMRDSGGVHPWGEAIFVPCDCAAPAQPAGERVLLRRKIKLGAMNSGTGPWMQVFDKTDHYNDAEFAWATIERC